MAKLKNGAKFLLNQMTTFLTNQATCKSLSLLTEDLEIASTERKEKGEQGGRRDLEEGSAEGGEESDLSLLSYCTDLPSPPF